MRACRLRLNCVVTLAVDVGAEQRLELLHEVNADDRGAVGSTWRNICERKAPASVASRFPMRAGMAPPPRRRGYTNTAEVLLQIPGWVGP